MLAGGALAGAFGWLVGTGQGAGMALMFVLSGFFGALVGLAGYAFPAVRNAEESLPDHDTREPLQEAGAAATAEISPEYTTTGT